jgi:phage terminase large subunit
MKSAGLRMRHDVIYADSAEPKSIEELYRMGWNIKPAEKGKDSIVNGIDFMKQYNLHLYKKSLNLIKEFRNYTWAKDKYDKNINKPIDDYNHAIDAARYGMTMELKGGAGKILSIGM